MNSLKRFAMGMFCVILLMSMPLQAGGLKKVGQAGMKWLSIPMGARAAGMGSAFSAIADDASSVFWNPAGIAYTEGVNLFANRTQWFADINLNSFSVTYNAGNIGVFALSYAGVEWGVFHGTQRANNAIGFVETGNFTPTDWAAGISYAKKISHVFAIGGNIRYLSENLGTTREGNFDAPTEYTAKMDLISFDFGTVFYTGWKDLRIAMTLQNFSKEAKYRLEDFSLPLTFKFGVAMDLITLWSENSIHKLTLGVDALHLRDYSERLHVGLEYSLNDLVYLRGGYKFNYDDTGVTLGAGILYGIGSVNFGIDYSYIMYGNLSDVHMFSIQFGLD
jgi:long-subunit fatty acid transport protein